MRIDPTTGTWITEPNALKLPDNTLHLAYKAVFGTAEGKRVLDDLWRKASKPPIDYSAPNPEFVATVRAARMEFFQEILARLDEEKNKPRRQGVTKND